MEFSIGDVVMICRDTIPELEWFDRRLGQLGVVKEVIPEDTELEVLVDSGDWEEFWYSAADLELLERKR